MLQASHGTLTATELVSDVFPKLQSGDLHIFVGDLTAGIGYVSFYAPANSSAALPKNAYDRQFTALDMDALLSHTKA